MKINWRAAGTNSTSAYYNYAVYVTHLAGPTRLYNANLTYGEIGFYADVSFSLALEVSQPYQAENTSWMSQSNGIGNTTANVGNSWGMHYNTASFDGFTLTPPSGSITGELKIYSYT